MQSIGYHPNIVNMLDYNLEGVISTWGSLRACSYSVSEFWENGSLYEYVKRYGPLPEPVAWFYFHQLVCAIKHLHDQNIAHCDIKPGNIFLDSNFNLKLGDFGCSIQMKGKNYGVTQTFGTKSYMAPEVFKASKKTPFSPFDADIYALGATLYFITSGETPSTSDTHMSSTEEESNESQYPLPVYIGDLDHLDMLIIDIIEMLICYDPKDRPDISELIQHPWFEPREDPDHTSKVYEYMSLSKVKSSTSSL